MQLPTIHLNGSNGQRLLDQYIAAIAVVADALAALRQIDVNGRDYYVKGPQIIGIALDEHQARQERLASVLAELEQIAMHISDQVRRV